jgi:hypothetical protein
MHRMLSTCNVSAHNAKRSSACMRLFVPNIFQPHFDCLVAWRMTRVCRHEARVVIVGENGSGKSSLACVLAAAGQEATAAPKSSASTLQTRQPPRKYSNQSSERIRCHSFSCRCLNASASSPPHPAIRINLWDLPNTPNPLLFSHALHPCKRCVYLYVWKPWDWTSSSAAVAAAAASSLLSASLPSSVQFSSIISSIVTYLELLRSHEPGLKLQGPLITLLNQQP